MIYFCCDERRVNALKSQNALNGIDFLEVSDNPADAYKKRQCTLFLHFVNDLFLNSLREENILIEGGERIRNIKVVKVICSTIGSPPLSPPSFASPPDVSSNMLTVEVDKRGDFSTYTLRLVQDFEHQDPPEVFDPILSTIDFSFKAACPSDFDCRKKRVCPTEPGPRPEINYLAKDYASFRQLMLDRMSVLMPQWKERNPADLGIALTELMAYVGDYLSYQQDAVATEAYLSTARRRVSVRRHARLIDYFMHDGCNARVWMQVCVKENVHGVALQRDPFNNGKITKILTKVEGVPNVTAFDSSDYKKALSARPVVFELMHNLRLFTDHNKMHFYTWGNLECCLPRGAMRATLRGSFSNLKKGDVLIFKEVLGPQTGEPEDANPAHCHAVRLSQDPVIKNDPIGRLFDDFPLGDSPPHDSSVPVTEIEWHQEDALPFPLCISARYGTDYYDDVSVALGNIVLADYGMTTEDTQPSLDPDTVPEPNPVLTRVLAPSDDRCEEQSIMSTPPRFRPQLKQAPLTHAALYNKDQPPVSASAAMRWSQKSLLPAITLREVGGEEEVWEPKRDLLGSHSNDQHFVAEIETDGTAYLRFGDDQFGKRPTKDTKFIATYRIGNGTKGNVGPGMLVHIVSGDPGVNEVIEAVVNHLPAKGGSDPESTEQVRQYAPSAFYTQERAVTPEDYANVAKRCDPSVQQAAATFRWTGSWHTVFLTVDRLGGEDVSARFEKEMRQCLERYRMAGHDIEIDGPRYVPLEMELAICVKFDYFRSDVKAALLEVFSNHLLADGRRGLFHPDNFTFGQTVYLSPFYAAAQALAGVDSVAISTFQRMGISTDEYLKAGKLELGRLEIARLDNAPNFPERGVFNLKMLGGR